ncbi:aminopeptidase M1-like isoform X7 [Quercus robur]|uniref:aminopeptidase M1-like isoform X7 n=1 Tax=Quercus robur TaxID=38942 RepID=UPI00216309AF|nr:aminopeptidase M1-like isoform X7 [Quercus robur]
MSYINGIGCGLLLALASYFYIRSRQRPDLRKNMKVRVSMEEFKGQPRLPKFAVPKRYDIKLKPNLTTCKFAGSVAIELKIVADTSFIILNAVELSIDTTSVSFTHPAAHSSNSKQQVLKPLKVDVVEEDEILVLNFGDTLPIGLGLLTIHFQGSLNDKMKGFYISTYEHNDEKKNMAVTQFKPDDARRCFPCWDEPACKATFKITLDVPSELVALSNMPIIEEKVVGDLKTVSYQESPIMSTYSVAIVVGLFDYVEHLTSDGVKVRVYCQVSKVNPGKFALDVAVRTLELYEEYFAMPYSLPKLDMVAIPDFAFGSMENYGLVTYCETALLYDVQHSTTADKQRVVIAVAHELAHQWFGNLVTMEWRTHLWLNEGFATWVSYLAADRLFPEWKVWTQFLDDYTEGLGMDGLRESHPFEVKINHASEIDEIIDSISYIKGASVIRMLQSYLGADCFQRSLASYVKNFACSNAKTEDLWDALEEESGEPVNKLMNSWTKQKGYPVVSVKVKDQKLEFEQSRFLASGSHGDGQWIVPITLCCGSYDARKNFLLQTNSETLDMKELMSDESNLASAWVKLNVDQTGFYRVEYDEDLEARLRNAIKNKYLSATDRFGILDDSFALCMARQKSFTSFLELLNAYKQELEYTVLSNLIKISYKVDRITADAAPGSSVASFFIELFLHSAMKLGWEPKTGESHLDAMLRGEVLTALAVFGHDLTLKEASRRFLAFLDDRNTPLLHPDIRKAVYVAVMRRVSTSNRFGYESLLRVYRETNLSQEKARILSSLTSSPDPNITLEALNFLLSSEVRTQDAVLGLAISREGRETAWSWLKFASFEKAEEIQEFFASRTNSKIARTLKQSIERVHINAYRAQGFRIELQNLARPSERNFFIIRDLDFSIKMPGGYCIFVL